MCRQSQDSSDRSFRSFYMIDYPFAASARFAAHRFLRAATILARPFALSFRLDLAAFGEAVFSPFSFAHLALCAAAIALRPAALIRPRLRFGASEVELALGRPSSIARSSAIWASMRTFCASKPSMAAEIIAGVSRWFGIKMFRPPSPIITRCDFRFTFEGQFVSAPMISFLPPKVLFGLHVEQKLSAVL
jgi:hypothetical protein